MISCKGNDMIFFSRTNLTPGGSFDRWTPRSRDLGYSHPLVVGPDRGCGWSDEHRKSAWRRRPYRHRSSSSDGDHRCRRCRQVRYSPTCRRTRSGFAIRCLPRRRSGTGHNIASRGDGPSSRRDARFRVPDCPPCAGARPRRAWKRQTCER
jgi:hypothetical protein